MSETQFAKAERLGLELYFLKEKVKKLEDKIAKLEKVAEAARPFIRSLHLVQTSDIDVSKGWEKELALQDAIIKLDSEE